MHKEFYIKTLSPVNIGTGKFLETYQYFLDKRNNILYRINEDYTSDLLSEKFGDDYLKWITNLSEEIAKEKDNKKQSKLREKFNFIKFLSNKNNNQKIIDDIISNSLYKIQCDTLSNKKQINEIIKNYDYKLYIPGSSLKGSIRTALLYNAITKLNTEKKLKLLDLIIKDIEKIKKINDKEQKQKAKYRLKSNLCQQFESEVFYCGIQKIDRNNKKYIDYTDQKFDLLRFLSVKDSNNINLFESSEICLIDIFTYKEDEPQGQTPAVEAIGKEQIFKIIINIDDKTLFSIINEINNKNTKIENVVWIRFKEKFERLYNLKINELNESNISEKIFNSIFDSLRNFGEKVKEKERNLATLKKDKKFDSLKDFYENLENGAFKLGFSSGFPSITIILSLLEEEDCKNKVKKILEFFEIGKPRNISAEEWKFNINKFPISRRVDNKNSILSPLGWVIISNNEPEISINQTKKNIDIQPEKSNKAKEIHKIPTNLVKAQITDDTSKPPKVKILDGDCKNQETILPSTNLQGLGLKRDDEIYVVIHLDNKKKLMKAEYKRKA